MLCGVCRDAAGPWAIVALAAEPGARALAHRAAGGGRRSAALGVRAGSSLSGSRRASPRRPRAGRTARPALRGAGRVAAACLRGDGAGADRAGAAAVLASASAGFEAFEGWVEDTARMLRGCPCLLGCPSCVQSPKCGNLNEPLDKAGALALLERMFSSQTRPGPKRSCRDVTFKPGVRHRFSSRANRAESVTTFPRGLFGHGCWLVSSRCRNRPYPSVVLSTSTQGGEMQYALLIYGDEGRGNLQRSRTAGHDRAVHGDQPRSEDEGRCRPRRPLEGDHESASTTARR